MLNKEAAFVLLAGNRKKWDDEVLTLGGALGGGYDKNCIKLQEDQHKLGRRSARLHRNPQGWCVYLESLDDFEGIVANVSIDEAIRCGIAWANEDPENRVFYARKRDLVVT